MNSRSSNNFTDNQIDDKSMDNISQSSSPNLIKDEKFKISNESVLSSSSSSSFASSFSPNLHKNFQSLKLDWYKQYEESWKFINQQRLNELQNFIKPNHLTHNPLSTQDQTSLNEKFYHSFPPPHHFLLAQYANIYGTNNINSIFPNSTNHGNGDFDKEKEPILNVKQNYDHDSSKVINSKNNFKDENRINNETSSPSNSRTSSPNTSEMSDQFECDEENLLDDNENQSFNANNGEWTYEEQFKQVKDKKKFLIFCFGRNKNKN